MRNAAGPSLGWPAASVLLAGLLAACGGGPTESPANDTAEAVRQANWSDKVTISIGEVSSATSRAACPTII